MHAFDVLGDPVRRRILELLAGGELTAGAVGAVVQEEFGISQPGVSAHLKVLREAGFATVRPDGAPLGDVWDACTNPERIARWFLPVSGDLREGGSYQLEGNAGGRIERCDPPHGFTATWEWGGNVSWIELRLREANDGGEGVTGF